MDDFRQFRRVSDSLGYQTDYFLVALSVGCRDIVADTDVTTLQCSINLAEFAYALRIESRDMSVILTKLLNEVFRNITAFDKVLEKAGGYPLRIFHVTLLSGKLFDEVRIDQFETGIVFQHSPHWHPVDARAFHTDLLHMEFHQFGEHLLKFWSQNSILFLKNDAVFIENTDEHTIFVHVKTAYLSHRLQNYWDNKPVKLMLVRMAVMPCPLLPQRWYAVLIFI